MHHRWHFGFIFLLLILQVTNPLIAQEELQYDEFPVYVSVPYVGVTEIDAVISGEEVFLSVNGLFDFLKIKNLPSQNLEKISGFFINPDDTYIIDRVNNSIVFGNRTITLSEGDLIRSETNLYLRSDYFGKVFGLDCRFSFRDLTVTIDTKLELPRIREMRQDEMRKNITRLKGDISVDTTIGRSYPAFRFGMADWSVYASEQPGGLADGRLNLSLGSVIAGGEATASLTFYTETAFSEKQQYYMWRHVNNDRAWLRQIMAGKITTQAISSLYNPVVGVQLTNSPTTFRRSFGTYTLTDRTEPDWTVELYVNNVLVDYVKADASGFFTFEVPLVYGNTIVKLKFYGPWGEERTREQNISIPYNFLPHKEFEYTVSAGFVEDSTWSRFSRSTVRLIRVKSRWEIALSSAMFVSCQTGLLIPRSWNFFADCIDLKTECRISPLRLRKSAAFVPATSFFARSMNPLMEKIAFLISSNVSEFNMLSFFLASRSACSFFFSSWKLCRSSSSVADI